MTPTATATRTAIAADAPPRSAGIPLLFHVAAAAWVGGMLALSRFEPVTYEAWLQEDRLVEWSTVALFGAAGILRLRRAIKDRAPFDALVALFCLFVAGEEFSWGQRLLGFTPPQAFLEHNTQQELTLHNFADIFGRPKSVLMLALAGYALLAVVARLRPLRSLLGRIGASPPPLAAAAWLVVAVLLLAWYPADYTGEWVEALAGGVFLFSSPMQRTARVLAIAGAAALLLTMVSARPRATDSLRAACADAEVRAIVSDLERGAALPDLLDRGRVHKRLFTAQREYYVDAGLLTSFATVPCTAPAQNRRAHGIDPWGNAYWVETARGEPGERVVTVYSFGPNRRRDERAGRPAGDDISATGLLAAHAGLAPGPAEQ